MSDASDLHNALAGDLVRNIVKPIIANGGSPRDVLVLTESVVLGVCLFLESSAVLEASPDGVVDALAAAVKERWAEQRALHRQRVN
jgi:hypothetical protein